MSPSPPDDEQTPAPTGPETTVTHHSLVQAPVAPMDADGLGVVTGGTVVFAAASVVAGIFYADLSARGDGWWLGACIAGFVLGLLGLAYCWNRRRRRQTGDWSAN